MGQMVHLKDTRDRQTMQNKSQLAQFVHSNLFEFAHSEVSLKTI
jgi:hypothetical protein